MQEIEIPVKHTDLDGHCSRKMEKYPIMDPHLIIDYLFNKCGVHIPAEDIRKYWMNAKSLGCEWAKSVPDLGENDVGPIPLGVYGDSAKVKLAVGSENICSFFMNIILWRPRSVRASRFLLFCIQEEKMWHHYTLHKVMQRFTWSFNLLWYGYFPYTGPFGEELSSSLKNLAGSPIISSGSNLHTCQVSEVRGDWGWMKKIFRFKNCSWNGIKMCHFCPAMSKCDDWAQHYWNLDSNSWQDQEFSTVEFLNERMPSTGICFLAKGVHLQFHVMKYWKNL